MQVAGTDSLKAETTAKSKFLAVIHVNLDGVERRFQQCGTIFKDGIQLSATLPLLLSPEKYEVVNRMKLIKADSSWLTDWLVSTGVFRAGDTEEDILEIHASAPVLWFHKVTQRQN